MATIARSMKRGEDQTLPEINERIRRHTQARVDYYASHRDQIPERLLSLIANGTWIVCFSSTPRHCRSLG